MSEKKQELTFEEAIKQLEVIVDKLEHGDVPLEEAITYYKEGMNLSKQCHDRLKHVEEQMEQILRENGEIEPFTVQEEE